MFNKPMIAACCGLAASTLMLAPPATATGDEPTARVVLRDGTGDVWKVNARTSAWTKVGDLPAADMKRAVVTHRRYAVVVRVRLDDLRRVGSQTYWTGITTPGGDFFADIVSKPGSRVGRHTLYGGVSGAELPCKPMSHEIDYADDLVRLRVPRSCLDSPKWVRVNVGNILVTGQKPHRRFYADNPHDHGPYSNVGTRRLFRG